MVSGVACLSAGRFTCENKPEDDKIKTKPAKYFKVLNIITKQINKKPCRTPALQGFYL
jgi:hypothetical protein